MVTCPDIAGRIRTLLGRQGVQSHGSAMKKAAPEGAA
jgi:predicted nucleic acid-binding Zn ribbon protein